MKSYNISEARENFASILKDVEEAGESVVLTRYGKPVASIRPVEREIPGPGFLLDEGWSIKIAPDFDEIPPGFEEYV
jgi:prevent-host-death family protein